MPRSEAQTRFELIDPALEDRGWDRRTDIRVEETAKPIDIVNHHDGELTPERIRGVLRADVAAKKLTDLYTGQTLPPDAVPAFNDGSTLEGKLVLPDRVKAMSEHLFARLLATGDRTPLQKTIVFCASDHHADLITNALNGLYGAWAKANGQKRIQHYAFKCMSSVNGQALIPEFRGRAKSHIIATTKDLLKTGVNVPKVRNIVFFRYVQSPLLFHQMIGHGTRIDRESGKLMFRIFDYTGATALFGEEFVTPPPPDPGSPKPEPPDGPPVQKVRVKGVGIELKPLGNYNLLTRDGRLQRVGEPNALETLRQGGQPAELLRKTKETLFAA